jgi:hypothetical protein
VIAMSLSISVPVPERNLGPPQQAEGAPIRKTGTPPELTLPVDDLTKSVRQPVDGLSRAAKIYALIEAGGEEITS